MKTSYTEELKKRILASLKVKLISIDEITFHSACRSKKSFVDDPYLRSILPSPLVLSDKTRCKFCLCRC